MDLTEGEGRSREGVGDETVRVSSRTWKRGSAASLATGWGMWRPVPMVNGTSVAVHAHTSRAIGCLNWNVDRVCVPGRT